MSKVISDKSFSELDNSRMNLNKNEGSFSIDPENESPTIRRSKLAQNTTKTKPTTATPLGLVSKFWDSISLGFGRQKDPQPKAEEKESLSEDENDVDLHRCAKKVLRELCDMDKEEIINELLDNNQIQNEEELRALEDDLDEYFAEEYGDDSDEESRAKFIQNIKKGVKRIKIPDNKSNESGNASRFVIDIDGDDAAKKKKEPEGIIFQKGKATGKSLSKPKQRGTYEVFTNPLSEVFSDVGAQVHLCYTREEEVNISRYELFTCEYNTPGNPFNILLKKRDPRHIFLADRILYISKKSIGNFGVIEEHVPLARLTKIFSNQKGDILRLNYYDDETPDYAQKEISLKVIDQSKLLSLIQKNLQGINSSIRIHQAANVSV